MYRLPVLCLFALLAVAAVCQEQIQISPVEGFNLKIIARPAANVIEVKPDPPIHNWWAAKFVNLPVGQPVQIRVNMNGCDTPGNVADTAKWAGLRPVYTYADPDKYQSYEWFRKDAQGRWVSGDLFKRGEDRVAGAGALPVQTAIPAALAQSCLSADGSFWFPWGEIEGGANDVQTRIFTFTIQPAAPVMTVAMHIPYLVSYDQAFIARLKAARFPGVFVDEIGLSVQQRTLYMIRVDDPVRPAPLQLIPATQLGQLSTRSFANKTMQMTEAHPTVRLSADPGSPWGDRRVFFINAREHPSEHTGSWAVVGALRALVADTPEARRLRTKTTWLLQTVFDPDGVAEGGFDPRTEGCWITQAEAERGYTNVSTPESLAYIYYLRAFANAGYFFPVSATFYGLECNDGKTIVCPFAYVADKDNAVAFNHFWFGHLASTGLPVGAEQPLSTGFLPFRLATACTAHYKSLSLTFMINDRYPDCRLTPEGVEMIGADFVTSLTDWIETPVGAKVMTTLRDNQQQRLRDMEQWTFRNGDHLTMDHPTLYEVYPQGF